MTLRGQREARDRIRAREGGDEAGILFRGATVLTMGRRGTLDADVLVRGDRIDAVAPGLGNSLPAEAAVVVDATGMLLMPGLVDSHVHAWEGQLRGLAPDADFNEYVALTHDGLARHYAPEDIAVAEQLTAAQAINAGTTTIVDNSHNSRTREHSDAAIEALLSTGIRAVYAAGPAQARPHDGQLPADLLRLRDEYFAGQDRVALRMFDVQPSVTTWTFARDHGFDVCAEVGPWIPDLEGLVRSGLMREGHTYNHCTGLSPDLWRAIADSGAAVNLVPRSDAQFGLGGFAPVLAANRAGVQEGLSSDNELSYGHDLFSEMRTLLTIQRGLCAAEEERGAADVPRRYGAEDVLRAATVGGARNAGLASEIGTIEPGRKADLVLLALDEVPTRLRGSAAGTVVSFAGIGSVDTVLVDGRVRKWGGRLVGVRYDELARRGQRSRDRILAAFGVAEDRAGSGVRRRVDASRADETVVSLLAGSGHAD